MLPSVAKFAIFMNFMSFVKFVRILVPQKYREYSNLNTRLKAKISTMIINTILMLDSFIVRMKLQCNPYQWPLLHKHHLTQVTTIELPIHYVNSTKL